MSTTSTRASLPAATVIRPYVLTQILASLGESETSLSERTVKKLRASFPIPAEQELIWAQAELGTRSHGVVLTDAGVFLKDGAPYEEEDEPEGADDDVEIDLLEAATGAARAATRAAKKAAGKARGMAQALTGAQAGSTELAGPGDGTRAKGDDADGDAGEASDALEEPGLGYFYIRWESFDVARVSHEDGWPTLDGKPFLDGGIFKAFAMACVRVNNRRVRMRNAGRRVARRLGVLGPEGPVRSVCRTNAAKTVAYCFDAAGEYKFYDDAGAPIPVEVPADQYDACLTRMCRRI